MKKIKDEAKKMLEEVKGQSLPWEEETPSFSISETVVFTLQEFEKELNQISGIDDRKMR